MTQIMTIMEDFLNMFGYKYLRLDGSTKAEERADLLKKFNAPESEYFIFLLSTRAGGLGLNLQSADTVIFFDSDWNPHQDLQAQDRAHRIGQTKEVRIFRLVTIDSIEEYILERAQFKLNIDGKVIQAGKFDQKSTNEEREAMLRALFEARQEEKNDVDEIYNDEELNEIICRNDAELELFKKIDEEREAAEAARYKKLGKPVPARLMERSELPEIYVKEFQATEEDEGDGRRQKKQISYAEDDFREFEIESPVSETQKRDQKDLPVESKKIKLYSGNSAYSDVYHEALKVLKEARDATGRYICEMFIELPSKEMYPDYYVAIKRPIAIDIIEQKMNERGYSSIDDFKDDVTLMFDNAMTYNIEGSWIYQDAQYLKNLFLQTLANIANRNQQESIAAATLFLGAVNEEVYQDDDESDYDDFLDEDE